MKNLLEENNIEWFDNDGVRDSKLYVYIGDEKILVHESKLSTGDLRDQVRMAEDIIVNID